MISNRVWEVWSLVWCRGGSRTGFCGAWAQPAFRLHSLQANAQMKILHDVSLPGAEVGCGEDR